ncbi:MAG: O-antigen ligase family protein [Solirubrobacteraceae bacterium]
MTVDLWLRRSLAVTIAVTSGLGIFAAGYYDSSVWGPMSLGFLALSLALWVSARELPSRAALTSILGLAALWVWSLLSRGWSTSPASALVDANRWALYAAVLASLVTLLRGDRAGARALVAAATLVVVLVGAYVLVDMFSGDAHSLFLGTRLNGPLGYVNGQANYLLLGFWPLFALAEQVRRPAIAALGLGCATTLACILFVAQSRGSLLAFAVSAIVLMAILPGRRIRFIALALGLAAVYVAFPDLAGVYRHTNPATGDPTASALRHAANASLLAGAASAAAWGAFALGLGANARRGARGSRVATRGITAIVAAVVLGVVVIGSLRASAIDKRVHSTYDGFVKLHAQPAGAQTRLFAGGGTRYDYWRIAWSQFLAQPLRGVGAGGFEVGYYQQRKQTEAIHQPHSIELQTLAELGSVGGLLLLVALTPPLLALVRRARGGWEDERERVLLLAAGGGFLAWLVQTSVDWMHLIPSVTAVALCFAAVLIAPHHGADRAPRKPRTRFFVPLALAALVAVVTTADMTLAQHDQARARKLVATNSVAALSAVASSLRLQPDDVQSYYVQAAALARLNLYTDARAALRRGLNKEPSNWVTWTLLGDLAVRHGDVAQATAAYARARQLNPLGSEVPVSPASTKGALARCGGAGGC